MAHETEYFMVTAGDTQLRHDGIRLARQGRKYDAKFTTELLDYIYRHLAVVYDYGTISLCEFEKVENILNEISDLKSNRK